MKRPCLTPLSNGGVFFHEKSILSATHLSFKNLGNKRRILLPGALFPILKDVVVSFVVTKVGQIHTRHKDKTLLKMAS